VEIFDCGSDSTCASTEDPIATVVLPEDPNPIYLELEVGWYLIRETPPAGYNVLPSTDQIVMLEAGGAKTVTFINQEPQGCSPGYWKNHIDMWSSAGVDPTSSFYELFGVMPIPPLPDELSAEEAINLGGGGFEKLARHGMAALLNAFEGNVVFPYSADTVIYMVQQGMADDATPGETEATELAEANNLDCPLP
jgi:hypothetical protein